MNDSPALTSDGISGIYKMGEVLKAKGDIEFAIEKFVEIIVKMEKIITLNPNSNHESQYLIFALAQLSDIYAKKKDYKKSLLFRNLQNDFLLMFSKNKNSSKKEEKNEEEEDSEDHEEFFELTTTGKKYLELFARAKEAIETPDKEPEEDLSELAKRYMEAKKKDEEVLVKKLEETAKKREEEVQQSFILRMGQKISDYPFVFAFIFLAIAIIIAGTFALLRTKSPASIAANQAKAEAMFRENQAAAQKATRNVARNPYQRQQQRVNAHIGIAH